jgi:lysine N6-hydroxylase
MTEKKCYDIIGIGIGPFNLGLAALAADIPNLDCIFIDQQETFNWHPGLLLPTAKMQVPFYADLVTLANPCSRFNYLNYLKTAGRLFRFAINESYFPYRTEFNDYCQWVVQELSHMLQFGYRCLSIVYESEKKEYRVMIKKLSTGEVQLLHGKHIILGTGTVPAMPPGVPESEEPCIMHAANYLHNKTDLLNKKHITIIGSGQSAAEIFNDLLPHMHQLESLHWYTRSARFYPMDYSKLTLELSSPDYIDYFYSLGAAKKKEILADQQYLYRGINTDLIQQIYDHLYIQGLNEKATLPKLQTNAALKSIRIYEEDAAMILSLEQSETGTLFEHRTEALIMATGYKYNVPICINTMNDHIQWTDEGDYDIQANYSIDRNNSVFVQNADLQTHGFNSADLGLGPYRNAVILNTILGFEHFIIEKRDTFQTFAGHVE